MSVFKDSCTNLEHILDFGFIHHVGGEKERKTEKEREREHSNVLDSSPALSYARIPTGIPFLASASRHWYTLGSEQLETMA